jgi:hypothetical protein
MSQKLKHQSDNVVALATSRCTAEGCKAGTERMTFCGEHYEWFKFGLVDKSGKRPSDFDKKFDAFAKFKKIAA